MLTGEETISRTKAYEEEGQYAPVFYVTGDTNTLYKKEISINIKDRFIG